MTKAKVVSHLNENIGLSKRECKFFWSFVNIISSQLIKQKDVKIVNFGFFKIKNKARIGKAPKTKQEVMISERNVIKFKPSNFLINLINVNTGKSEQNKVSKNWTYS